MRTIAPRTVRLALFVHFALATPRGRVPVCADDGTGAASTDTVAKRRQDDFEELQKKHTTQAANQRLEILRGLAFVPCGTARKFLLGVFKKSASPGDERVVALQSVLHMVDDSALEVVLATLAHERDKTLWQVFGESIGGARSEVVRAWLKGPALASRDLDALGAVLDSYAGHVEAGVAERIETLYDRHKKPPGSPEIAARALRAFVLANGPTMKATLLDAVHHVDARVRLVAADILPSTEPFGPEIEAAVRGLLADETATIRQVTAARVGDARRAILAGALVPMLGDARVRTRHVAALALEKSTGQKFGRDLKAWTA